jgi:hypothetical protein
VQIALPHVRLLYVLFGLLLSFRMEMPAQSHPGKILIGSSACKPS